MIQTKRGGVGKNGGRVARLASDSKRNRFKWTKTLGEGKAYSLACQDHSSRLKSKQANRRVALWRLVSSTLGIWTSRKSSERQYPPAVCQVTRAERPLKRETVSEATVSWLFPTKAAAGHRVGMAVGKWRVSLPQSQVNGQQPALTPRVSGW